MSPSADTVHEVAKNVVAETTAMPQRRSFAEVWLLVAFYSVLYIALGEIVSRFVLTDEILDQPWLKAGLESQLEGLSEKRAKWRVYGYVVTPLFVVVKIGYTAVCLAVGTAFAYWEVRFSQLFRIAVDAEAVWACVSVIHLLCVLFFVDVRSVEDYTAFYPLSALNLVEVGNDAAWALYLLKSLNVFEVAYAAMLVVGLRAQVVKPTPSVASVVAASYGGGLILVVASVTLVLMALL